MKQKYVFTFKGPDDPADKLRRKMTVKAESLRDAFTVLRRCDRTGLLEE